MIFPRTNLPNRATGKGQENNSNCGIFPEPLKDGLSILLPHLAIEAFVFDLGLFQSNLDEVQGHPPA